MEFQVILCEEMKDGLADGCYVVCQDYEYLPQSCLLHQPAERPHLFESQFSQV